MASASMRGCRWRSKSSGKGSQSDNGGGGDCVEEILQGVSPHQQ
jgi:hypothetical protein